MIESMRTARRIDVPRMARSVDSGIDTGQVVRRLRRDWTRRFLWRILWFVGVPTCAAIVYYGSWASDQFDSTAVIAIHEAEPEPSSRSDSILSTHSNASANGRELLELREFIESRSMFDDVDGRIGLTGHFQNQRWDVFARLARNCSRERAFKYYRNKVAAEVDSASGTLALRVRAFDPRTAKSAADTILARCEAMLTKSSERARLDLQQTAERQIAEARQRLLFARRNSAQRDRQRNSAGAGPASVGQADVRGSGNTDDALEQDRLDLTFAEKNDEAAVATLAEARAYEARHRRLLVTLSKPALPDDAAYPRRLTAIFTVMIFSTLVMGIGTLTISAVREHVRG